MLHTVKIISAVCCTPPRLFFLSKIRISWLRGVLHTSEIVSMVCCTWLRFFQNLNLLTPWCVAHLWDCLRGVLHISEIVSLVCYTPVRLSPLCVTHLWDCLRGVLHTCEIVSVVYYTPVRLFPGVLHTREIVSEVCCTWLRFFHNLNLLTPWCVAHLWDMWHTSAVYSTPKRQLCERISQQNWNWIRKYSSLFNVYQGPKWVRIMTGGRKSRDTLPLIL